MPLPYPDDPTSLVLRTDFSDDAAWETLQATIDRTAEYPSATYVSDPVYAHATVEHLVDTNAATDEHRRLIHLFVADTLTFTGEEHTLLAIDLFAEPGRMMRVTPRWFPEISVNLAIANVDFAEFAESADASGVFRGWDDE